MLCGYVYPPTTGYYIFTIASDDNGQLWLSTNSSPANLAEIAYVSSATGYRDWSNANNYEQTSTSIYLTAGYPYYIMALAKHGTDAGDNLAVRWEIPATAGGAASTWEKNSSGVVDSTIPIPGIRLAPAGITADTMTPPAPTNLCATVTGNNNQVTLTWSPVQGLPSGVDHYNIYRDGTLYDTSPTASYVDKNVSSQTRHSYQVTAVNFDLLEGVKSAKVTAVPFGYASLSTPSHNSVQIKFTEPVDPVTARTIGNYSISGVTISAALLQTDGYTVTLTTSALGSSSHAWSITGVESEALSALPGLNGSFTYSAGSPYVAPPFSVGVNPKFSNDTSPALTGTITDPAASVTVRVNGSYYAATNNGNGTWSLPRGDISAALAAGIYNVVAAGVNTSGHRGLRPFGQRVEHRHDRAHGDHYLPPLADSGLHAGELDRHSVQRAGQRFWPPGLAAHAQRSQHAVGRGSPHPCRQSELDAGEPQRPDGHARRLHADRHCRRLGNYRPVRQSADGQHHRHLGHGQRADWQP